MDIDHERIGRHMRNDERAAYDRQLEYLAAVVMKIEERLDEGSKRMNSFETSMKMNNEMTGEIHAMFVAGKGGLKVLGWLGSIVRWLGMIAMAALAIYTAAYALLHGGAPPK